jgi:D-3-phosphoglycerate dehydrogenase
MTTILVNNPIHEAGLAALRQAEFDVVEGPLEGDELEEVLATARGLVVRSGTTVTPELLDAAPYLEVIGRAGVGVDNIHLDACEEREVVVFNTPSASTNAVAELALGHMLSVARHLPRALPATRDGRWVKSGCRGRELADRTLGVVGLGRIGARVAELAQGLGMEVEGFDPHVSDDRARELGLDALHDDVTALAAADVVTVHTPLTDATRGLLDAAFFEHAEDLVVVNTARGGIVDEDALLDALEGGRVLGAGLDVFEEEPPGKHPLLDHPRVSATPHIGAQTEEAQRKAATLAAEGILGTLEGDPPPSRIV